MTPAIFSLDGATLDNDESGAQVLEARGNQLASTGDSRFPHIITTYRAAEMDAGHTIKSMPTSGVLDQIGRLVTASRTPLYPALMLLLADRGPWHMAGIFNLHRFDASAVAGVDRSHRFAALLGTGQARLA